MTICIQDREEIFGKIGDGKMETTTLGDLVISTWESLPDRFLVTLDVFQIMPNHFHGIIIVGAPLVGARFRERAGPYIRTNHRRL